MPGASYRLPAEGDPAMPQYTIKLHTYDPDIVAAFERLRKNRKQAAFTHEALKHFIASGKASQIIALMSSGNRPPAVVAATGVIRQETARDAVSLGPAHDLVAPVTETGKACNDVLQKIFE